MGDAAAILVPFVAVAAFIAVAAVTLLVSTLLRERCPRCGGRWTCKVPKVEEMWLCEQCYRYFGPGATRFYHGGSLP